VTSAANDPIAWHDYAGLRAALNEWRERRNISFDTLDRLAGTPERFSSKTFGPHAARRVTMDTLLDYLASLAIKGTLEHDPAAFAELQHRLQARNTSQVRNNVVHIVRTKRDFRDMGRIGGANSRKYMTRKAARKLGKKAAAARWAKVIQWNDVKEAARNDKK
jgi:hypothetical protein